MEAYEFTREKIAAEKVAKTKSQRAKVLAGAAAFAFVALLACTANWFFGETGTVLVVMMSVAVALVMRGVGDEWPN